MSCVRDVRSALMLDIETMNTLPFYRFTMKDIFLNV